MKSATIDGIKITADFDCTLGELENYVEYVTLRVDDTITDIFITTADDGLIDVSYVAHGQKFERIRRITGEEIAHR